MKKFLTISSFIVLVACNNAKTDTKQETAYDPAATKAEINTSNQQFEQAFVKGDSIGVVALYHTDAKVFPPNMDEGNRTALGSIVATVPKMGIKNIRLNTSEVMGGPDQVVETGSYEMSDSSKVVDKGHYIVVWKKEGDKWKIYRDIWNSSNRPAAAK